MMKKKEEKIIEQLRELVNKHNKLLVISELFGIPLHEESEITKDMLYEHPDMIKEFFNGEEIELEDEDELRLEELELLRLDEEELDNELDDDELELELRELEDDEE